LPQIAKQIAHNAIIGLLEFQSVQETQLLDITYQLKDHALHVLQLQELVGNAQMQVIAQWLTQLDTHLSPE